MISDTAIAAFARAEGRSVREVRAELSQLVRSEALQEAARTVRRGLASPGMRRPSLEQIQLDLAWKQILSSGKNRAAFLDEATAKFAKPWSSREGWEAEPPLPIKKVAKQGVSGTFPVEPGYELYNELVGPRGFRPFRTAADEPRVAIPGPSGLDVRDPSDEEFVDQIGHEIYTLKGDPIPRRKLAVAAKALKGRAMSPSLPSSRVVELGIRVRPKGKFGGLLDLCDAQRRCVSIGPDGWMVESMGYPVFDRRGHMRELPEPQRSPEPDGDPSRAEELWKFALVEKASGGRNPRLLVLSTLVEFLIRPRSPKPISVVTGPEGVGKTSSSRRLQGLVDPSITRDVRPPAKMETDYVVNLALNHAVINLDNVSAIDQELSDDLCRLSTGGGFSKRRHYTMREEFAMQVYPWVIINGITAAPRAEDLLRRTTFLPVEAPAIAVGEAELEESWRAAHPRILGGLLDLASSAARILRDSPPSGPSATMAEFASTGRAVAVALGQPSSAFDRAWEWNVEQHTAAALENPLTAALQAFFERMTPGGEAEVTAGDVAEWINRNERSALPRGPVSASQVRGAIDRAMKTLERTGIHLQKRLSVGKTRWSRGVYPVSSPPSPPYRVLTVEESTVGSTVGSRWAPEEPTVRSGGLDRAAHRTISGEPTAHSPSRNSPSGGLGGLGGPLLQTPENASSHLLDESPLGAEGATSRDPVPEESNLGTTRADRLRKSWPADHPEA